MIDEAVAFAGDFMAARLIAAARAGDPLEAVDAFFAMWHARLVETGFRAGCPIGPLPPRPRRGLGTAPLTGDGRPSAG
ncbi:hypothetical protein [Streptomyces sp. NPDC090022]|uniref:hypothetical protein n=1 Tax=Streptomyces sp. NPDC090022 TaxID=3365920 RepID=UPI003811BB7F